MQTSSTTYLSTFLYMLAFNVPYMLTYLVGMILSLVFRKRIGKAAIFTLLAFLLFVITSVITIVHSAWVYFFMYPSGNPDYNFISTTYTIVSVIRTLLEILAFVLLIIAIFAKRNDTNSNEPPLPNQF
jgi:hypothetical protein